jgi:hypothetical protein
MPLKVIDAKLLTGGSPAPPDVHDIHDFVASSERWIQEEYTRIQKRATEDPGTAGDQGEENWAELLKGWLPAYFHIVTKGRILAESGYASPQIDLLVLTPSYPKILLDKKLYLAGGVVAAFECKTTLKADHIRAAVETSAALKRNLPKRQGSPYRELISPIAYGLLAHSHSWKLENSTPIENIETTLWDSDQQFVSHPIECLDYLCVADLGTWTIIKMPYMSPSIPGYSLGLAAVYGPAGSACSGHIRHAIGQERQKDFFSPLGVLFSALYSRLAFTFTDMRTLEQYFRRVDLPGVGEGRVRNWDISIYSEQIRERVFAGAFTRGEMFDEWHHVWF